MASVAQTIDTVGYCVVGDVLDPSRSVQPLMTEYETVLNDIVVGLGIARQALIDGGQRTFAERYVNLVRMTGRTFSQHFDVSLPRIGVEEDTPLHLGPAAFWLLRDASLLDVVEQVLGPEIFVSPIQHVRIKPPQALVLQDEGLLQGVPWHQDQAVVAPEAQASDVLTVWVPLTRATTVNGCLQVIPGSHRRGPLEHCPGTTTRNGGVAAQLVAGQAVPVPMAPGSVLLMDRHLLHSALPNMTAGDVRISLDLRYQRTGETSARPAFPGFVGRSRRAPRNELVDPVRWASEWFAARTRIAEQGGIAAPSRWTGASAMCA